MAQFWLFCLLPIAFYQSGLTSKKALIYRNSMFGFLKGRRENKLLEKTIKIIGKALILEVFNSENAIKLLLF